MANRSVYSTESSVERAVSELAAGLAGQQPRMLMYFASPDHDPREVAACVRRTFVDVPAIGCTTAGELTSGRMLKGSIVMLGLDADSLSAVHIAAAPDAGSEAGVSAALTELAAAAGAPLSQLDPQRYVGLVLHDGLAGREEAVMSHLSTATNVPFVGGSAGDSLRFQQTSLFVHGEAMSGGVVFALLEPARGYSILKTQSFDVRDETLEVTEADEPSRAVLSFNGRPAAEEYARVIGVLPTELEDEFIRHPVGLVLPDGEPFVRSPQQLRGSDVVFYCQVKAGMRLHLLSNRNIVEDTDRDLRAAIARQGGCAAIINFHCILRTLELEQREQCEPYAALFRDIPTVGFSTYGESYIGHINQTSTMLLLR